MADQDVNNIMQFAFDGKPLQFKSAFDDAMREKLADVLAQKHDEVATSVYGGSSQLEQEVTDEEDISLDDWDAEDELTPEEESELDNDEDI